MSAGSQSQLQPTQPWLHLRLGSRTGSDPVTVCLMLIGKNHTAVSPELPNAPALHFQTEQSVRTTLFESVFRALDSGLWRNNLKNCFTLPFDLRRVSSAGRLPFGDSAFIERSAAHSLGACSIQAKSALLLLVTRILADDHNATLALNDLALLAHRFN